MLINKKEIDIPKFKEIFKKKFDNFCNKSSLNLTYTIISDTVTIKDENDFLNSPIVHKFNYSIEPSNNIATIRKELIKYYPVIYDYVIESYSPEEIENMVKEEKISIIEALGRKKEEKAIPKFIIYRVINSFNELNVLDIESDKIKVFKYKGIVYSFMKEVHKKNNKKVSELFNTKTEFIQVL